MKRIERLYDWLAQGPTPECDQALTAALAHAESPYFEQIVAHLLQRGNEAAWAGLIANYRRVPQDVQARLQADGQRLRAGFARALTASDAPTRAKALDVLAEHPCPPVAYLLPDLLRDTSDEVRKAAAQALRCLAESLVNTVPAADWDQARHQEYASARTEVARALSSALHTFDLHYRLEVVEVGLWFARDLGDELWEVVSNRHSQCGNVVSRHLPTWNSPQLARFLLEALAHRAWRPAAQEILRCWTTPQEIVAILRNTDVLANEEIRRRLNGSIELAGFSRATRDLSGLPADVRALAPRWVAHLSLSKADKIALLTHWHNSGGADVQRACAEALAALNPPDAPAAPAPAAQRSKSPTADPVLPTSDQLAELWPACRDEILAADAELTTLIRKDLDVWRPRLIQQLGSRDPRDRLLGLRVVASTQSGRDFQAQLRPLRNDPVETIRELAGRILDAAPAAAPAPAPTAAAPANTADALRPEEPPTPPGAAPQPDRDAVRRKLRATLTRLLSGCDANATTQLVGQVRTLLRELSAVSPNLPSHDTVPPEVPE